MVLPATRSPPRLARAGRSTPIPATRLDPRYAAAYAKLSGDWLALPTQYASPNAAQAIVKARSASRTALALNSNLTVARLASGKLFQVANMDWRSAEAEVLRASELAPNGALVKGFLSTMQATLGKNQRAVELARAHIVADPRSADAYYRLSSYLTALGRLDEARQAIDKTIKWQPQGAAN